eukprot:FR741325.1.p1 GENE.FR741325.1~~FR741325.1.p1  ORF type:complete len:247 (+),score=38.45 FR741325.1:170-910(+)
MTGANPSRASARRYECVMLPLLVVLGVGYAADTDFDSSYAHEVCGTSTAPPEPIKSLCLDIQNVGAWYSAEVRNLGVSADDGVESSHPQYQRVRALGIRADLRVQERMVAIAKARMDAAAEAGGTSYARGVLKAMRDKLKDMEQAAEAAPFMDQIADSVPPGMEGWDAQELLKEAQTRGVSVEELLRSENGSGGQGGKRRKGDGGKKAKKKGRRRRAANDKSESPLFYLIPAWSKKKKKKKSGPRE